MRRATAPVRDGCAFRTINGRDTMFGSALANCNCQVENIKYCHCCTKCKVNA